MNLHQIIEAHKKPGSAIEMQQLRPYKKSLLILCAREYEGEAVLMVTDVFNACQYARVTTAARLDEELTAYLDEDKTLTEEDREAAKETILFNSILLKNL